MNFKKVLWDAPTNVSAICSTRLSGVSISPYNSNNLAQHVGDDPKAVEHNRRNYTETFQWHNEPVWLNQTHSNHCVIAETDNERNADAAITSKTGLPLVILTADCLPILFCNRQGTEIAAVHAGWRGLASGVVENTLKKMRSKPNELLAWIGPAICGKCYEVGNEVREAFLDKSLELNHSFTARNGKWLANLPILAKQLLTSQGLRFIYLSNWCTFEEHNDFYSYRKNAQTGRIGSFIWLNDQPQD